MVGNQTDMGGFQDKFRTTRWSLISEIRDPKSPGVRSALNELLGDYWKPIYCHIRKKGVPNEQAKDLTQDFFYSVLYEKDVFKKAKCSRGKFRSFLLTALDHYLIDKNRYETARKRSMYREILNTELLENIELSDTYDNMTDQESFDYTWIAALIENVSANLRKHYCSKGKEIHWIVFDRRVKIPVIEGTEPPSLLQLCAEYGISNVTVASNMITTVKRAFRKALRTHIREYVCTDSEVDEELSELFDFLRKKTQDAD